MRLTPTDLVILRELLGWSDGHFPRGAWSVSSQAIATKTGLHRNTVQRRMKALADGGVIEGFLFEPHPGLLGLIRAGHRFDGVTVAGSDDLARRLKDFPWVSMAILHMDGCFLHTWHGDGDRLTADINDLADALGAARTIPGFRSDQWPPGPADAFPITDLDRRILVALRRGTRRSPQEVANVVGVTRRTVARRMEKLIHAGAMMPMFRPGRIEGLSIAVYECPIGPSINSAESRAPEVAAKLAKVFPDRIMGPVAGPRAVVLVPVSGLDEAARRAAEARDAGILGLELQFMRDGLFPEACDGWLSRHVQNAPPDVANP